MSTLLKKLPSRLSILCLVILVSLTIEFIYMERNRHESRLMTAQVVSRSGYNERDETNDTGNTIRTDANPVKKILVWTRSDSEKNQISQQKTRHVCSVNECEEVFGKDELKTADAIVFKLNKLTKALPERRYPHQQYVAFGRESPQTLAKQKNYVSSVVFNITLTYRRDSDIFIPYGSLKPRAEPLPEKDYWLTKNSSKMVSWVVSNCHSSSGREKFVRLLRKYIHVDVYGKCGDHKDKACGPRETDWNLNCPTAYDDYMFYLALENSICLDYVTQKMFLPMMHSTIPVVFGGADYATVAPPNSYIDALSFPGPKELAQYLKKVASNSTLFNSYHAWRQHYTADMKLPWFCDLCAFLHGKMDKLHHSSKPLPHPEGVVGRVNGFYPDFHSWYFKGGRCTTWSSNNAKKEKP